MKLQKSLMVALAAGGAFVPFAAAQNVDSEGLHIGADLLPHAGYINNTSTGGFDSRVIVDIYDAVPTNTCPGAAGALFNGDGYLMDDVNFNPGPWGATYTGARQIANVRYVFQTTGWSGTANFPQTSTPTATFLHTFEFYEPGNFSLSPMLSNPTPFATRTNTTTVGSGYAWTVTEAFATPVDCGTRRVVWVALRATDTSGNRFPSDVSTGPTDPCGDLTPFVPGQAAAQRQMWVSRSKATFPSTPCVGGGVVGDTVNVPFNVGFANDSNANNSFQGGAVQVNGHPAAVPTNWATAYLGDHRSFATSQRSLAWAFQGDVTAALPTPNATICNVVDGNTAQAVTIGASNVYWVRMCLGTPVTDAALRYLNIDTEGSAEDLAVALYSEAGALIARDEDSGSATAAQMSFGVGRGAAVGDGTQYDGRDGELDATNFPTQVFYLAVAHAGTNFSGAFGVLPVATDGLGGTINISTNVNAGGSLPTLVTPTINHFDFTAAFPPVTFPASDTLYGQAPDTNPDPNGDSSAAVLWSKLEVGGSGATAGGGTYMDLDFGASDFQDNVMYVFNAAGDLVYANDDEGATAGLPFASFGGGSGLNRLGNNDTGFFFLGQSGDLPAGVYYIAQAGLPTDDLGFTAGTNRRFHVRGLSGNNIGHVMDVYSGQGVSCDSIDFNGDGLFPDTLDIDDFLSVFSGGPCSNDPSCGDIDFNNDGLFPDTLDIDALLSVFSGGACLR